MRNNKKYWLFVALFSLMILVGHLDIVQAQVTSEIESKASIRFVDNPNLHHHTGDDHTDKKAVKPAQGKTATVKPSTMNVLPQTNELKANSKLLTILGSLLIICITLLGLLKIRKERGINDEKK